MPINCDHAMSASRHYPRNQPGRGFDNLLTNTVWEGLRPRASRMVWQGLGNPPPAWSIRDRDNLPPSWFCGNCGNPLPHGLVRTRQSARTSSGGDSCNLPVRGLVGTAPPVPVRLARCMPGKNVPVNDRAPGLTGTGGAVPTLHSAQDRDMLPRIEPVPRAYVGLAPSGLSRSTCHCNGLFSIYSRMAARSRSLRMMWS